MALSVTDVVSVLRQYFPPGRLYSWWDTSSYIYKLLYATAATVKQFGFDLVDDLRTEVNPATAVDNLARNEGVLGISETLVATSGTTAQRQNAVVAKLRESGGLTKYNVRSIVAPILGYADPSALEVIECDRSALRLKHSYAVGVDVSLPTATTTTVYIDVLYDGGEVSTAGAQLNLVFDTNSLSTFDVTLTAPDGTTKTWDSGWSASPLVLYGKEFAGAHIQGRWQLDITHTTGSTQTLYTASTLFVEGVADEQATAGAVFHWGVYADPDLVGGSGVDEDLASAHRAVRRIRHAHHEATLILSKAAYPSVTSGAHTLIPGRFLPGG
jgi:uncharacterized protein YmfQ (DUF2313 family)